MVKCLKVLIGGETSGKMRDAFRRLGHDAISCDLEPSDAPGPHYLGNYWDIAHDDWDLGIFHPTCTFMCNSSSQHIHIEEGRWDKMVASAEDFKRLDELPYPHAIENPIMLGYAQEIIGRGPDQIVQPWWFGHRETKATCWWLKDLWKLRPTNDLGPPLPHERAEWAKCHRAQPGPLRWKERSETKQGMADACAWQWGGGRATGLKAALIRADYEVTSLIGACRGLVDEGRSASL